MLKSHHLLLINLGLLCFCEASKILVVFPFPSKSHSIIGNSIVKHLLQAGHEITYVTPFPIKNNPRLQQIDVSLDKNSFPDNWTSLSVLMDKQNFVNYPSIFVPTLSNMNLRAFEHENFQQFLYDQDQEFDVILIEWLFSEFFNGLSAVFRCPYIWIGAYDPHWAILSLIDEATNPAYVPAAVSANVPPFTFLQRAEELWNQFSHMMFLLHKGHLKSDQQIYEEKYGPVLSKRGISLPPYEELKYNVSMVLGNSHASFGVATRLPQNYKPVGGFHIDSNLPHLPEDLKAVMDNSKDGVIYFSMGTILKSNELPVEVKSSLLQIFGELNQTILWKFEEELSHLPKNVHILKWAPQSSILSHPNVKLFITHGGMLSIIEAVHFGVPIVGIPVYSDQFNNVNRAVQKGYGKKVDLSLNMANDLKNAIMHMLSEKRYGLKAKELSLVYHDRPSPPAKELVHWVEHVVKTRGAPHLRSPALMVPWYQKIYLDLLVSVTILLTVLYLFVNYIIKYFETKKRINIKQKIK